MAVLINQPSSFRWVIRLVNPAIGGKCLARPNGYVKVSHLGHLAQRQPERRRRVPAMIDQRDRNCDRNYANQYGCETVCRKEIRIRIIAEMNRDYFCASWPGTANA